MIISTDAYLFKIVQNYYNPNLSLEKHKFREKSPWSEESELNISHRIKKKNNENIWLKLTIIIFSMSLPYICTQ